MRVLRLFSLLGLVLAFGCKAKAPAEDPLAKYQKASAEQAKGIGEAIEKGFAEGHPEVFDSYMDMDAIAARLAQHMDLSEQKQQGFIDGFKKGAARGGAFGQQIQKAIGTDGRVKFLRAHTVSGQQRAVLRTLTTDGMVNFYDLVVSVDPSGKPRVVDFENYASGELLSESMRTIMAPLLADVKKSFFERLLSGRDAKKEAQFEAMTKAVPKIRAALAEGKHAEALQMYNTLPAEVQSTRIGLILRMSCSQGLGDAEYERALDAINAAFPDDPSLALIQIDRHYLKKDWQKALDAIKRVSRGVGGDAYLDVMQASVLVEKKELAEAYVAARKAIEREPTLPKGWWMAVTVALEEKDHPETARLLTEIEKRFDLLLSDLRGDDIYADFVRSPEYRVWMQRERPFDHAAAEE
jgi:tetratricopeptide (TPR) repeat protein